MVGNEATMRENSPKACFLLCVAYFDPSLLGIAKGWPALSKRRTGSSGCFRLSTVPDVGRVPSWMMRLRATSDQFTLGLGNANAEKAALHAEQKIKSLYRRFFSSELVTPPVTCKLHRSGISGLSKPAQGGFTTADTFGYFAGDIPTSPVFLTTSQKKQTRPFKGDFHIHRLGVEFLGKSYDPPFLRAGILS
jgi:hypothetical protein